jgi:hypothetical protein
MEPMLTHLSTKKTASSEEAANIILALKTLEEIINKQARTISDVASLRRREATSEEEKKRINKREQDSLHALREHFDPSTFRSENPYLCSEKEERALRAFAKSTDLEAWLWSHQNKGLNAAKVALYAARIRLLVSMTLMQTETWLLNYLPTLSCIALECAAVARINYGEKEVTNRMYSALNDLIEILFRNSLRSNSDDEYGGIGMTEVIFEGKRVPLYEACTEKFIEANALAINDPVACVIQWLELRLGNKAKKPDVIELLRMTFKPLGEDEKQIINTSYVKFTSAYAI